MCLCTADVSLARRTLFDCADGCVGVLKRQHPTEKTMEADEGVYPKINNTQCSMSITTK